MKRIVSYRGIYFGGGGLKGGKLFGLLGKRFASLGKQAVLVLSILDFLIRSYLVSGFGI